MSEVSINAHRQPGSRPSPAVAAAGTPFNGIFIRPNLNDGGTIPAPGPFCISPDIWIAGTTPVDPATLITAGSYAQTSSDNITIGATNYIYVRGRNAASTAQSRIVQLYYGASAIVQWPGQWQNNKIPTDQAPTSFISNLDNLAPNAIGVARNVFQWTNVPPVPAGSDHYCLMAQFNDVNNSNPFPNPLSQIDMGVLIATNLAWGWRNTVEVPGNGPTWASQVGLSVAANMKPGRYLLSVAPTGFTGWSVALQCSQVDANGAPIQLPPTLVPPTGQTIGLLCPLNPGFNASLTVSMFQNGAPAAPTGSNLSVSLLYLTDNDNDATRAVREGLVDRDFERMRPMLSGITAHPAVKLGAQHYVVR